MKKIIFILLLTIFCPSLVFFQGSQLMAQNWSNEQSKSLWDLADETGEYYRQYCDSCHRYIEGKSKEELERNIKKHNSSIHFKVPDNNTTSTYEPSETESGNDSESSSESYSGSIIDIYEVAENLQKMGIDNKYDVIDKYERDYLIIKDVWGIFNDFIRFITTEYRAKRIFNIEKWYNSHYLYVYKTNQIYCLDDGYYKEYKLTYEYSNDYDYIFEINY